MADFSKQWCDENDPEMPHDFDIMEEFNKLQPGYSIAYICEGYGFIAIGNMDGECMLLMPSDDDENVGIWRHYTQIVKS